MVISKIDGKQIDASSGLARLQTDRMPMTHQVGWRDLPFDEYLKYTDDFEVDVRMFGAKGDVTFREDIVSLSGNTLTLPHPIKQDDLNKQIIIWGAHDGRSIDGSEGHESFITGISADGKTITLAHSSPNTIVDTRVLLYYFADDTAAIQSAIDHFRLRGVAGRVTFPDGHQFAISKSLYVNTSHMELVGKGSAIHPFASANVLSPGNNHPEMGREYDSDIAQTISSPRLLWVGPHGHKGDRNPMLLIQMPFDINDTFALDTGDKVLNTQELKNIRIENLAFDGAPFCHDTTIMPSAGILVLGGLFNFTFRNITGRNLLDGLICGTQQDRPYRGNGNKYGYPIMPRVEMGVGLLEQVHLVTRQASNASDLSFKYYTTTGPSGIRPSGDVFGSVFHHVGHCELDYSDHNQFYFCGKIEYRGNNNPGDQEAAKAPDILYFQQNWCNYHFHCEVVQAITEDEDGKPYANLAYGMIHEGVNTIDYDLAGQGFWKPSAAKGIRAIGIDRETRESITPPNRRTRGTGLLVRTEEGHSYNSPLFTFDTNNDYDSDSHVFYDLDWYPGQFVIDFNLRQNYQITCVQDTDFKLVAPQAGSAWFRLDLYNAHLYTTTFSDANLIWDNNTLDIPVFSEHDVIEFFWNESNWYAYKMPNTLSTDGGSGLNRIGDSYDTQIVSDTTTDSLTGRVITSYVENTGSGDIAGNVTAVKPIASVKTSGTVTGKVIVNNPILAMDSPVGATNPCLCNDAKIFLNGGGHFANITAFRSTQPVVNDGGTLGFYGEFYAGTSNVATINYAFYAEGGVNSWSVNSATGVMTCNATAELDGGFTVSGVYGMELTGDFDARDILAKSLQLTGAVYSDLDLTGGNYSLVAPGYSSPGFGFTGVEFKRGSGVVGLNMRTSGTGWSPILDVLLPDTSSTYLFDWADYSTLTDGSDASALHTHGAFGVCKRAITSYDWTPTAGVYTVVPFDGFTITGSGITQSGNAFITDSVGGWYRVMYKGQFKLQTGPSELVSLGVHVNGTLKTASVSSYTPAVSEVILDKYNMAIMLEFPANAVVDLRLLRATAASIRQFDGFNFSVEKMT